MTDLLEKAVEAARRLPPEAQDDIARLVLVLSGEIVEPVAVNAEDRDAILRGQQAALRGDFASSDEISALWAKHGL
ncbi:hypothetical protein [Jiella pacifica]|uniref:Uncharacterized protein n=1 Tax=Jiella pacifica TaxID=2696469 RepID=A0A6N9TBW7_9HYPH|nr:hypothetical protein [Jiella pacifica]NDW07169.1 hypothetical protein [Jiella pacifica]